MSGKIFFGYVTGNLICSLAVGNWAVNQTSRTFVNQKVCVQQRITTSSSASLSMSPNSVSISELIVEKEQQAERHSETERKLLSVSQGILKLVSVISIIHF